MNLIVVEQFQIKPVKDEDFQGPVLTCDTLHHCFFLYYYFSSPGLVSNFKPCMNEK